ncbi:MAG TPA: cyclic nucleotide-binding domain-containing protein [Candidatus Binatia bacterium]|nr:cyclic nucleotide-binding domain-containing protein [Candidatus Binatia bacterium]
MKDPRIELLRQVPLFAQLSAKQLDFVVTRVDEVDVAKGETLIREGDGNHAMHIIVEGEAQVTVAGTPRRVLGPGAFFGEISMMDRRPATATVTSLSPLRLLVLSHAQFRDAIKADLDLSMAVLATMAQRLRDDAETRGDSADVT